MRAGSRGSVDGVVVVDKPSGMTSHDVVAVARRVLGERRIGHTGTLDPLATGVLPLACGRATRLIRFLGSDDKAYEAAVRFGMTTDTYDITGTVTARTDQVPAAAAIEAALEGLRGDYLQEPPAFSAKKVGGERAYARARRQQAVVLAPVPVRVTRAELLRLEGNTGVFAVTCSAGFYVRSFAYTLGARTGTGACLEALRRTRSGAFTLHDSIPLDALPRALEAGQLPLVPPTGLLPDLPAVRVTAEGVRRIAHGRAVGPEQLEDAAGVSLRDRADDTADGWVKMLAPDGTLAALGRPAGNGTLHPSIVLI